MNLNRKIALSAIFALGALYTISLSLDLFISLSLCRAVIVSTVRVVVMYQVKRADERADRHEGNVDKDRKVPVFQISLLSLLTVYSQWS